MSRRKRRILCVIAILVAILLVLQLQPLVIRARHGVAGSFGLRPVTHDCLGWMSTAQNLSWPPFADFEFHLGYFHFRYAFTRDSFLSDVQMCIGQDIWDGE